MAIKTVYICICIVLICTASVANQLVIHSTPVIQTFKFEFVRSTQPSISLG